MAEQSFRKWKAETEEHGWPENGMEAQNVFADDLDRGRPEIGDIFVRIAENRDVIAECVHPNVHDLLVVAWDVDSPFEVGFWS